MHPLEEVYKPSVCHFGWSKENEGFETRLSDIGTLHHGRGTLIKRLDLTIEKIHRMAFHVVQGSYRQSYRHYDVPGAYIALTVG